MLNALEPLLVVLLPSISSSPLFPPLKPANMLAIPLNSKRLWRLEIQLALQ
jgi:hypothetical protein